MSSGMQAQRIVNFDDVIAPISRDQFFNDYFERQHLLIQRGDRAYFKDLLTVADIDALFGRSVLTTNDVNMVNKGTGIEFSEFSTRFGEVNVAQVAQHFAQGATIILPQLQRHLPQLAAYCRSMETVFSVDLQTNIYFTPAAAQGFKTHYDSHDVVVLQTHGSKTWRIYESPLELPLRSQAFEPEGFVPGKVIDEFVLEAGDVLYIPRGVVHDARATDEASLHITTGLLTQRWAELLAEAVMQVAHRDVELRRAVPPGFAADGFNRDDAIALFSTLLDRVKGQMDPNAVLDGFADDYRRARVQMVPGQFLQSMGADAVEPGSEVSLRPDLIYQISTRPGNDPEDDGEVILSVYDSEISFPGYVEDSLRDAFAKEHLRVGDLAGELDAEGQAVMMRRLVREGVFIQRA